MPFVPFRTLRRGPDVTNERMESVPQTTLEDITQNYYPNRCKNCDTRFEKLNIAILKGCSATNLYCQICFEGSPLYIHMPHDIRRKYESQKDLDYTFLTKDGPIEVSKFALQHSDFYRQQCEGSALVGNFNHAYSTCIIYRWEFT